MEMNRPPSSVLGNIVGRTLDCPTFVQHLSNVVGHVICLQLSTYYNRSTSNIPIGVGHWTPNTTPTGGRSLQS
jgi:hypothetical protein